VTQFDFDLYVIGGGSGGVRAARMAAAQGARVGLAEPKPLGGTCVNVGCIPKKLYSYAAHYAEAFKDSAGFGWTLPQAPVFDWEVLKRNRAAEIARLNSVYGGLLESAGVQLHRGRAEVRDPHTVCVDGISWRARHILVATGGRPRLPDIPGKQLLLSSDDMFDLACFPRTLLVLGGGYIACEFASIFGGLGARVTQVHRGAAVLSGFDQDVRSFVAGEMLEAGIDLRLGRTIVEVASCDGGFIARLSDGSCVTADAVLCATGREPNTRGLGLEAAGVVLADNGAIRVDDRQRSSVPSIHAVGDVSSRVQLTPVATAEAMVLVDQLFGHGTRRMDYDSIPTAVFTHPNIATVGWTEAEARLRCGEVSIYRSSFKALKHTLSGRPSRTLVKLVVDTPTQRVVGLHMVGEDAGEVVQGFAVALRAGATKAQFDATLGIHPTVAEEFVTLRVPVAG
jgi:glutathione reductase (NADPH)